MHALGMANQTFVKISAAAKMISSAPIRLRPRLRQRQRRFELIRDMDAIGLPASARRVEGAVTGNNDRLAARQDAPIDSKVLRPMSRGLPMVILRKC